MCEIDNDIINETFDEGYSQALADMERFLIHSGIIGGNCELSYIVGGEKNIPTFIEKTLDRLISEENDRFVFQIKNGFIGMGAVGKTPSVDNFEDIFFF